MAGAIRIEMDQAAIRAFLQGPEVQNELRDRAEAIAAAAGSDEDFEVEVRVGATRARASVRTASYAGMRAEATDRVLTRALDAGRG